VTRAVPLRLLGLGAYVALLVATAPAWPDDWDGVGFVESVHDFDLARFHPHPPGYPVYVALLRVAALVVRDPVRACILVAAVSGAVAIALLWAAARIAAGERAAWAVGVLAAVTPLAWRACSGVGSEAPALACAAGCAWGLAGAWWSDGPAGDRAGAGTVPGRSALFGVGLGLGAGFGLGVRLSWAPLYVAMLALAPRGARGRAWAWATLSSIAWAAPLVLAVGPARLVALLSAHLAGHAERWGGTVVTHPGPARLAWLARDIVVDGLGVGLDPLGLAIGAAGALAAVQTVHAWRLAGWRAWRAVTLVLAPYLVWIALGQNLRDQPRHALPLVAALGVALGLPAGRSARARALVGVLAVLVAARTAFDAHARRTIAPPGQQLVELARAQPSAGELAVFGVASVRFFETSDLAGRAFPAGSLGDVQIRLTRLDALPARVWVTSEVEGARTPDERRAAPWPLEPVAALCRPARIDRRAPCIDVFDWKLPYLR
jgi:hypothetical protein